MFTLLVTNIMLKVKILESGLLYPLHAAYDPIKRTVSVISSDFPNKNDNARLTPVLYQKKTVWVPL